MPLETIATIICHNDLASRIISKYLVSALSVLLLTLIKVIKIIGRESVADCWILLQKNITCALRLEATICWPHECFKCCKDAGFFEGTRENIFHNSRPKHEKPLIWDNTTLTILLVSLFYWYTCLYRRAVRTSWASVPYRKGQ